MTLALSCASLTNAVKIVARFEASIHARFLSPHALGRVQQSHFGVCALVGFEIHQCALHQWPLE
jgi:hypothetical protein